MDFLLIEREIAPNTLVGTPLESPLDNLFFSNSFLLILPNLFSSNTPIPFL